jgi:hypothetical protein
LNSAAKAVLEISARIAALKRCATQRHAGEGARATQPCRLQPAGRRRYLLRVAASYAHAVEGAVDEEEGDQEEH